MQNPFRSQSIPLGALFLTLAWALQTCMAVFACFSHPEASIWMVMLFQSALSFALTLPWMRRRFLHFESWGLLIFRTACGFLGSACIFSALACTTIVNTTLLQNTAPLFLPIVLFLWLRQKVAPKMWIGIIVGFIGVAFILKPTGSFAEEEGALFGLAAGVLWAMAQIALRLLTNREKGPSILFYYFGILTLATLPFAYMTYAPLSKLCLLWLFLSALSAYLSQVCYVKAFTYARPIKINPFNYTGVIFSYIAGWLIWHRQPDLWGYLGIGLIALGTAYTLYLDKKAA